MRSRELGRVRRVVDRTVWVPWIKGRSAAPEGSAAILSHEEVKHGHGNCSLPPKVQAP